MVAIYKHLNHLDLDMIAFVQGQQDGMGNEAKQQEQGGNANEKRTLCQYSP
jgi:hypothetical protein